MIRISSDTEFRWKARPFNMCCERLPSSSELCRTLCSSATPPQGRGSPAIGPALTPGPRTNPADAPWETGGHERGGCTCSRRMSASDLNVGLGAMAHPDCDEVARPPSPGVTLLRGLTAPDPATSSQPAGWGAQQRHNRRPATGGRRPGGDAHHANVMNVTIPTVLLPGICELTHPKEGLWIPLCALA
jgi:hypothetical protein